MHQNLLIDSTTYSPFMDHSFAIMKGFVQLSEAKSHTV